MREPRHRRFTAGSPGCGVVEIEPPGTFTGEAFHSSEEHQVNGTAFDLTYSEYNDAATNA